MSLCFASAYAASQLVQLCQPETLGIFYHHHIGIGYIYPYFDDCGRYQYLNLIGAELLHNLSLFLRLHLAVQKPYMIVRKYIGAQMVGQLSSILQIHFFRFFYQRAHNIYLIPLCHLSI